MTGYLIVTGLFFLVVGLRALLKPVEAVAIPYNLTAETTDGKNYLRAGAGGVTLACAAVMLTGAFVAPLQFAAAVVSVTVLGGLLFGRAVSLALDGSPGAVSWISACFELLGFVSGMLWLIA
jgi:hypothetical protein